MLQDGLDPTAQQLWLIVCPAVLPVTAIQVKTGQPHRPLWASPGGGDSPTCWNLTGTAGLDPGSAARQAW